MDPEDAPVADAVAADAAPEIADDALASPTAQSPEGEDVGEPAADAPADAAAEEAEAQGEPESPTAQEAGSVAVDDGGMCIVDLIILPEHYGQTKKLDINLSIGQIGQNLEQELSIPNGSLFLMNMTGAMEVPGILELNKTLFEYGVGKGSKIGIELRINYYQEQEEEQYVMPDVLQLEIHDGTEKKIVPVLVERAVQRKPYLGGYRNKQSNTEYHHAWTQTPHPEKGEQTAKFHRETQTVDVRSRSSQCARNVGTQMDKPGLYISTTTDKYVTPRRPYFTRQDLYAVRLAKCLIIQCHMRGMFARRRARQLRKEKAIRDKIAQENAEREKIEEDLRHKREIERRIHPRTFEDFEVLGAELDAWRLNETHRIQNSNFEPELKQAALRQLLHKETKLLQTIDKLKIQAKAQNKDAKVQKKLESMAQPKVWAQQDLETTTVHTPFTTRARELMDLYNGLRVPLLSVDERLDVLLHVKWTCKEFDCNLTREIVDLVDREADMLNRRRPAVSFKGLRKRLANLFLQFVETPEFNPEALKYQKVPRDLYDQPQTQN